MEKDNVKTPPHYTSGKIECHQAIREMLGDEGYEAWCRGNVIKYMWRYPMKNGVEDIEKAQTFIDMLLRVKYKSPYT